MENTKTASNSTNVAFPNGNTVITPDVVRYVERYQTFARKTAESIIGLAKTLVEAEEKLNGVDFSIFCDEVGITKGDTTYSKLKKIGENASRFNPYLQNLPNAWTTIYQLAKLEPNKFAQIAPNLTPFSTAQEITSAFSEKKKNEREKNVIDLTISFGNVGSDNKKEVYDAIIELKKKFQFSIKEGSSFITEMKSVKQNRKVA